MHKQKYFVRNLPIVKKKLTLWPNSAQVMILLKFSDNNCVYIYG